MKQTMIGIIMMTAVVITLLAGQPVLANSQFSITDLGTLGGTFSNALDINDNTQIVGGSDTALGESHAFLWENSVMIDLGTLGGANSSAEAINNLGQIAGMSQIISGKYHAFLWENGTMVDLGTLGGLSSYANSINETGQVVGYSRTASGETHAFLWENGALIDLGTLGGSYSQANSINNRGQIVGSSDTTSGETHAFLWENGIMTDLGTLASGVYSGADDINEYQQIVGWSETTAGETHAFLWENGIMTDLGKLRDSDNFGQALAINNQMQIAGSSGNIENYEFDHAFLWEDSSMSDLGTLGGSFSTAFGINVDGQIVGFSTTFEGEYHAVLWDKNPNTPPYVDGDFSWARHMGGTDYDGGSSITADSSGNVYITGTFQGTADFDPGDGVMNLTSIGDADIFVSKLDGSGNFGWAKNIGGTGGIYPTRIILDSSGNIYLTGNFSGTIDFDPGAGISNLTAVDEGDIFVFKLNGNGDFVWAKSMEGGSDDDVGYGIAVDSSGNVYTTGYFTGTVDFDPDVIGTYNVYSGNGVGDAIFISKLDNNGNFVWAKSMGSGGEDLGVGIAVDSAGNVYIAGGFSYTVDFDPGTSTSNLTSAGSLDIFISKLNSNGDFVWAKSMGGTGYDSPSGLKLDTAANAYTTGVFEETADFDPGAGVFNLTSAGSLDIFISKLDNNGNFVWAKSMGGPDFEGGNSAVDSDGNVYTTGGFQGTADFDPGIGTSNLTSAGGLDIFISKLNSNGEYVWAKRIGGTDYELGSVAVDPIGNAYITGGFGGTLDFDPGAGIFELTSAGGNDIFIVKLWGAPSNLPPVADAGGPYTASEGDTSTLDASNSYDPEGGILTYEWDLDNDGEYDDGTSVIIDYRFPDDGNYQVGLKVRDVYGEEDIDTAEITVTNVSPIVNLAQGASVHEGATFTEKGSFSDPGFDSWTATVDYGDGTGVYKLKLNPYKTFTLIHTYSDNGNYPAQVCVTDDDGGVGCYTVTVKVDNVAPSIGSIDAPIDPVQVEMAIETNATFTEPGTGDTHTATWDWGDGMTSEGSVDGHDVGGSHVYDAAGVYTLTLTVEDDDGGMGSASFEYIIVYDPDGGFVTGSGWITSHEGAYTPDPFLTGKATFGFVSKYQKGANIPTGDTEFQFNIANLYFESTSYDWLVIAGMKAQFKGTGTINGMGEYKFILTAFDGSPDMFRIKIWDKETGEIIYDNQLGAGVNSSDATELGGGSIVVHK